MLCYDVRQDPLGPTMSMARSTGSLAVQNKSIVRDSKNQHAGQQAELRSMHQAPPTCVTTLQVHMHHPRRVAIVVPHGRIVSTILVMWPCFATMSSKCSHRVVQRWSLAPALPNLSAKTPFSFSCNFKREAASPENEAISFVVYPQP